MKTILHFNPEREHLDPPSPLSQLKIKLLLLKQTRLNITMLSYSATVSSQRLRDTSAQEAESRSITGLLQLVKHTALLLCAFTPEEHCITQAEKMYVVK